LRSIDRRAAQSVPNIFFKLKKIQIKNITDKVNLVLRRCKSEGKTWTAKDVPTGFCPSPGANMYSVSCPISVSSGISSKSVSVFPTRFSVSSISLKWSESSLFTV
jgi:hypothetical protein